MDQERTKIERWNAHLQAGLQEHLEHLKSKKLPELKTLGDRGLASLSSKMEAFCQKICLENGIDFEEVKSIFEARMQVIPARGDSPIKNALASKGVVALNDLDGAFLESISGIIHARKAFGLLPPAPRTMTACSMAGTIRNAT